MRCLWLGQARISWTFPRPHSIWQQRHCHSLHWCTAYHPGSREWLPHQTWCLWHSIQSVQPLMGQELPLHLGQTYFDSAISCLVMPLHALWTNDTHHGYRSELLLTPLQQTPDGYLLDFWRTSRDQELRLIHADMIKQNLSGLGPKLLLHIALG